MRRTVAAALLPAAAAVLAAGCGGSGAPAGSTTTASTRPAAATPPPARVAVKAQPKPWRTFARKELPRMALQPTDAPADLVYVREESGVRSLADMGLILPRQQRAVRSLGYLGAHDAVFAAKRRTSDRRVAERIWLFKKRSSASAWLERTRRDSVDLEFDALPAPPLGEESWAARGLIQIGGGQAITHAFRLGNAVFTVVMYGDTTPPNVAGALAGARAALARAKRA